MTRRAWGRLAWLLWALTLVPFLFAGVFAIFVDVPPGDAIFLALLPLTVLALSTVGALIAARHPGNPIGWIFLGVSLLWALSQVGTGFAEYVAFRRLAVSWLVRTADWLGSWVFLPGVYLPVTFLLLLFPDGHLPSRRWWPVAWASGVAILALTAVGALSPGPLEDAVILRSNPYAVGTRELWGLVAWVSFPLALAGLLGSVAALVVRYRRSQGDQRQQIKWLAYAGVIVAVLFILAGIGFAMAKGNESVATFIEAMILVGVLVIPLAAGIGILKYRLYDIDVVISKTVVYGALAAFITGVYVAVVVGIGALAGRGSPFLTMIAAVVVALSFQPIRDRVRRLANRLVYGKRATPYEVLSDFSSRMSGAYAEEDLLPRMARVVAEGTGAEVAQVWLRLGDEIRVGASWPSTSEVRRLRLTDGELPVIEGMHAAYPVRYEGDLLGALAVAKPRGEPLTPTEENLVADLASQAGLVMRNVRLTEELRARLEDLRASRQRLVSAQDEERRRLERNLHDGAQQQLVALQVKLGLLGQLARRDPDRTEELARQLVTETASALDDLRDLARGIYPPLLADQGLVAALEAQARKAPIAVEIEADGVGRYQQEAEAAVYFCTLEALQNVAKHADASRVVVRLRGGGGLLSFEVQDDGTGFDPASTRPGSGLTNMSDRLEALGGRLDIRSATGAGTTVSGSVPARPREAST